MGYRTISLCETPGPCPQQPLNKKPLESFLLVCFSCLVLNHKSQLIHFQEFCITVKFTITIIKI